MCNPDEGPANNQEVAEIGGGYDIDPSDTGSIQKAVTELRAAIERVNSGEFEFFAKTTTAGMNGSRIFGLHSNRYATSEHDDWDSHTAYLTQEEATAELQDELNSLQSGE